MERFVVYATMDLGIEIDAENEDQAKAMIAKAFDKNNPYDPLTETKLHISGNPVVKTAIIQDWEVDEIHAEKAL